MVKPIFCSIMQDVGGEKPAYCLMAAYRDRADAEAVQKLMLNPPKETREQLAVRLHHDAHFIFDGGTSGTVKDVIEWFYASLMVE